MRVRQIFLQYNLYVIMRVSLLTGGFQKEVDRIDLADSVMIKRRVVIKCDECFRILVADCLERGEFAFECRFISDGERN